MLKSKIRVGFLEIQPINNREMYTVSAKNNLIVSGGNKKRIDEEQFPWESELDNIFVDGDYPLTNPIKKIHESEEEQFEDAFLSERIHDSLNSDWDGEEFRNEKIITCSGCYSEVVTSWKFCPCCGKTVKEEEIPKEIKT